MRFRLLLRFLLASVTAVQLAGPASAAGEPRRHIGNGAATAASSRPHLAQEKLAAPKSAKPSHLVDEGGIQRHLWIDTSRVAEFGNSQDGGRPRIRAASPADLSGSIRSGKPADGEAPEKGLGSADGQMPPAANVSPIFLDASGHPRALPGGVIVSLKQALPSDQAREQLQAAGLEPLRRLGERMWLVQSPAGLPSLELAQRLHAEGRYDFAQPNWWHPRTTK